MKESNPRVLMPTYRLLEPIVSWASGYEFEDVICAVDDVDLVAVENVQPKPFPWEEKLLSRARTWAGIDIRRMPRPKKVSARGDYEVFFIHVMTPGQLLVLDSIQGWQESCRTKVCWVEELWVDMLQYTKLLEPLRQFDHVFVGHVPTPAPLSKMIDRKCSFLSPGVDALRFCPYPNPPARMIDFYSIGRRSPATHQSLLEYAKRRDGFTYLYDSARAMTFVADHAEHRERTASLIKRSRYFLADRAKANVPDQTKGSQVFGPRYFEGAAAGSVLVGATPKCDTFEAYFDWPDAVIPLEYGSTDIADVIDELDADPNRVSRARQANVTNMLRRHDWADRWATVLETLGLDRRPALTERQGELARRAQQVENAK
jgi:hypothetical protein